MILDTCALFFNRLSKHRVTRPLAKALYRLVYDFIESIYKIKMKDHIQHVHGLQNLRFSKEKVVACCLVRDGEEYIEAFLDHYFELGVEHIFLIDNGSTDKTIDLAKKDKRVSLYQTNLKFKIYKNILKRYMVEHFSNGGWVL